ncbi:MAG: NADP-dependent oxidoreductase [Actinobacteria bacterium]|nr:NADP-dependent oxidoreductase [Actinomycetota bacterium]
MSVLGMTGFTGYFGMLDLGWPEPGQTVLVSAASGAVGSVAAQVAKRQGARVVGIAGGPAKCAYLTDTLGLDAAIDYKAGPVAELLEAVVPSGIDIYFDNVGGETLDAALMQINRKARIIVCGGISQYGDMTTATGPANYLQLISKSATMTGFTMLDYMHRIPEALTDLSAWVEDGSLRHRQHILEGIESFPEGLRMLFRGETKRQTRPSGGLLNRGKHCFLGEHFQHDVEYRIDVALPPGLTAVEHLGDVLGIRHRPSMVAMVLPRFVPSGSPGVQDLMPVVLAVACTWR